MAILRINEIDAGKRKVTVTEKGERRYSRAWRVCVDSQLNGPAEAFLLVPIKRWEPYVESSGFIDKWALAVDGDCQREKADDPFTWIVTINYTSKFWDAINRDLKKSGQDPNSQNKDSPQNPLTRPPHYDYGQWTWQRALDHDFRYEQTPTGINGPQSMTNSAGDKFDPPYMFEEAGASIIVTRNEPFFDVDKAVSYSRRMNSKTMWGWGPFTLLCRSITGSDEIENGFPYSKVRYEFWIKWFQLKNSDGSTTNVTWKFRALDQGYNQLDPNDITKRIAILCPNHGVVMQPQLLDGSGRLLAPGKDPFYKEFWTFPAVDLNDLQLPPPPGA